MRATNSWENSSIPCKYTKALVLSRRPNNSISNTPKCPKSINKSTILSRPIRNQVTFVNSLTFMYPPPKPHLSKTIFLTNLPKRISLKRRRARRLVLRPPPAKKMLKLLSKMPIRRLKKRRRMIRKRLKRKRKRRKKRLRRNLRRMKPRNKRPKKMIPHRCQKLIHQSWRHSVKI